MEGIDSAKVCIAALSSLAAAGTPIASATSATFLAISLVLQASEIVTNLIPESRNTVRADAGPVDASIRTSSGLRERIFSGITWWPDVTTSLEASSLQELAISRQIKIFL